MMIPLQQMLMGRIKLKILREQISSLTKTKRCVAKNHTPFILFLIQKVLSRNQRCVGTASGLGISKAFLRMTDSDGNVRAAYTNPFGYYNFEVEVSSKRYTFDQPSQAVSLNDEITTLDFVAN